MWFAVNKIEPSHERSFEEARPEVEAQWRAEQVDKALVRQGRRSRQAVARRRERRPMSPKASARRSGPVADIRRDDKNLPEPVVAAIFREPADGVGSAATPDGRTVFKITADTTPPVDGDRSRASSRWPSSSTERPAKAWSISMSRRSADRSA